MGEPGQPKRRRIGCLSALGIFVLVIIAAIGGTLLWSRAKTNAIRDDYKARGLPTSLEELDTWYAAVPEAENAAPVFLAAADAIVPTQTDAERNLPIISGSDKRKNEGALADEELQAGRDYLKKNATALELAHSAARLTSARYPIDLSLGFHAIDTKPLDTLRGVARLLWLEGLIRAQDKNTAGAVESFSAAYAVGRSLSTEPLLIAQLVGVAIEAQTAREICATLSVVAFPASDLTKLAEVASQSPGIHHYGKAIAGEGVFGLFNDSPTNPLSWPTAVFDRLAYAENIISLFDASSLELKEAIVRIESMGNTGIGSSDRQLRPMASAIMPGFTRAFDSVVRAEIYRDLLLIALAVEKHRLEAVVLPETLATIIPKFMEEVPLDPYGDGPYLYLREDKGFAVYSIGPDRIDGRGEKIKNARPGVTHETPAKPTGDITLRIAR